LPWVVEVAALAAELGTNCVALINDLEANAYGLEAVPPESLRTIQVGVEVAAHRALISPGTGLGEAGLLFDGRRHVPFATEGGHSTLAPRDEREIELYRWLGEKLGGHVSYERVVSGPGIQSLYEFLATTGGGGDPEIDRAIERGEGPRTITERATAGASPIALAAVEWFVSLLGAEAGNLALKLMAAGGVFIGGGIAPGITEFIDRPAFRAAFADKGRLRGMLERIPIRLVLETRTALYGAWLKARSTLS
jgi:glucokinase